MSINTDARSWRRQLITIPANSVESVSFMDTNPNSIYIKNNGAVTIYCGFNYTPSAENCELSIMAGLAKTYGEQRPFARFMVYNPSANPVMINVISWEASLFDPALLQGDISVTGDLENVIKYDGVITGFTSALPEGSNHIGSVNVNNPTLTAAQAAQIITLLTAIRDKEISVDGGSGESFTLPEYHTELTSNNLVIDDEYSESGKGKITFLSNDGSYSGTLVTADASGNYGNGIEIKAGEVISDISFSGGFKLIANGGSNFIYRIAVTKEV